MPHSAHASGRKPSTRRSSSHGRTNSMSSVGRKNSTFGGARLGMTSAANQDNSHEPGHHHDPSSHQPVRLTSHRSETHLPRLGALQRTSSTTTIITSSTPIRDEPETAEPNGPRGSELPAAATKAGSTAANEDEGWESNSDEDSAARVQAQAQVSASSHRRRRASAASTYGKLTRNKSSSSIHRRQSDFANAVREVENAQHEKDRAERKGMFRVHSSQSDIHRPSPKPEQFIVPPAKTDTSFPSSSKPPLADPSASLSRAPSGISLSRRSSGIPPMTPAETPLPPSNQSSKPSSAEPSPEPSRPPSRRPSNASNTLPPIMQAPSPPPSPLLPEVRTTSTDETFEQPTRDPRKSAARHHSSISTEPTAYPFPSTSQTPPPPTVVNGSSLSLHRESSISCSSARDDEPRRSSTQYQPPTLRQTPSTSSLRSVRSNHTNTTQTTSRTSRPSNLPFLPRRLATLSGAPPGRTAPPQLSSDSARGEASSTSSGWPISSSPVHSLLSARGEREGPGEGSTARRNGRASSPVASLSALGNGNGSLGGARERTTSMASLRSVASGRGTGDASSSSPTGGDVGQNGQRRRMISSSGSSRSLNLKEGFRRSVIGGIVEAVGSSLGFDEGGEEGPAGPSARSATDRLASSTTHSHLTPNSHRYEATSQSQHTHHSDTYPSPHHATHLTSHFIRPTSSAYHQFSRQAPSLHPSPFFREHLSVLKDMPEGRNSLVAMSVRRCVVSRGGGSAAAMEADGI